MLLLSLRSSRKQSKKRSSNKRNHKANVQFASGTTFVVFVAFQLDVTLSSSGCEESFIFVVVTPAFNLKTFLLSLSHDCSQCKVHLTNRLSFSFLLLIKQQQKNKKKQMFLFHYSTFLNDDTTYWKVKPFFFNLCRGQIHFCIQSNVCNIQNMQLPFSHPIPN